METFDNDAEQNGTQTVSASRHQSNSTKTTHPKCPLDKTRIAEPDSEVCANEMTETNQTTDVESLKSSLSTTAASVVTSSSKVKVEDKVSGQYNSCDLSARTSSLSIDTVETDSKDQDGEDDELDFLLSLENPVQVKGQSDVMTDVGGMENEAESQKG